MRRFLSLLGLLWCASCQPEKPEVVSPTPVTAPSSVPAPEAKSAQDETFTLATPGEEKSAHDVTVRYVARRHKHGDKFTVGIVEIELSSGGKQESHELRGSSDIFRAEWVAFERLVLLTANASDESLSVTVFAQKPPTPLTREEATQRLLDAASQKGLPPPEKGTASSLENGILSLSVDATPSWVGEIGVFTQKIYELQVQP